MANIPGLLAGGYAGNRLGAIRDAKGKSVAAVFAQLGGDQKAQVSHYAIPRLREFILLADLASSRYEGVRNCNGIAHCRRL